ncbi:DNA-binding protein [Candidatus Methanobinarius endosymbioticus]|uniref:DNA-binding protein ALNOE001_14070 n=1 Tax=Candidatus Methanobinarius endosymbioticus TaxID=2006182 RepID=A0A366M9W4_9EURY|nr:DNA-binding protein [Candidatus Methanobinarius endosymbioticus]
MSDLDELRRKRMKELHQQAEANENQQTQQQMQQKQMQQEMEAKKKQLIMQILTPEARSRLANLRLTKPEFVEQIELQLIQLAQSGRVQGKITDEQLKVLLKQLSGQKRDINIIRR